jgi:acyl-CoA thioester hydrolase
MSSAGDAIDEFRAILRRTEGDPEGTLAKWDIHDPHDLLCHFRRIGVGGCAFQARFSLKRLALAEEGTSVQDDYSPKCDKRNPPVTASLDGEIRDGRHHMRVRVYFEDTDAGQIVYHANFLRFMERGRTNYLRLLGTSQQELLNEARKDAPGFAFVVRSMKIDFLKPAVLDDLLDVVTIPQEVRGASIMLDQEVRRGDELLLEAKVKVAFVSGGRAKPIPKALRIAMKADQI